MIINLIILLIFCYLIGSISSAILISKLMCLKDPRSYGSGNPGATNVLRSGNKIASIATLIGDFTKGAVAILISKYFFRSVGFATEIASLGVFLGHLYPIFFQFNGGKGVATAIGIILTSNWMLGIILLFVWFIIVLILRIPVLATIISAILAPYFAYNILNLSNSYCIVINIICVMLIGCHHSNIMLLWKNFLK